MYFISILVDCRNLNLGIGVRNDGLPLFHMVDDEGHDDGGDDEPFPKVRSQRTHTDNNSRHTAREAHDKQSIDHHSGCVLLLYACPDFGA